ncbi:TlpA disulfide reductase family protein [Lachnospiraceae bacterium 46-61]
MKNIKKIAVFSFMICTFVTGCSSEKQIEKQSEQIFENQQTMQNINNEMNVSFSNLNTFEAKTLNDEIFTQSDFSDKDVTVINFWSLLCGPCIEEMPDIAEFSKKLPDNVQIITVCLDGEYDTEITKQILEESGFDGTTLLTGDGDFQKIYSELQYTPTSIFVDKYGNIVGDAIIGGQKNFAESYTKAINDILKSMGKEAISIE